MLFRKIRKYEVHFKTTTFKPTATYHMLGFLRLVFRKNLYARVDSSKL